MIKFTSYMQTYVPLVLVRSVVVRSPAGTLASLWRLGPSDATNRMASYANANWNTSVLPNYPCSVSARLDSASESFPAHRNPSTRRVMDGQTSNPSTAAPSLEFPIPASFLTRRKPRL